MCLIPCIPPILVYTPLQGTVTRNGVTGMPEYCEVRRHRGGMNATGGQGIHWSYRTLGMVPRFRDPDLHTHGYLPILIHPPYRLYTTL